MLTMFTLTLLCLAGVAVGSVLIALVLALIGLPLAILLSLLPWLLRLAGVTGGPLIAVWIGLMALAVLLAVFLPARALQNKGGRS